MISLYLKEIRSFLSSAIGVSVLAVFLALLSIFLWIVPGSYNILDSGYANLDSLFSLAPWVFLFLGPAVSMRAISEELRMGTLELLLTKPITEWQLIIAKFFAAWTLILLALLPTLTYYFSVNALANPAGNVDHAMFWGSFAGLILLSAAFVAMGIFASSLTGSQIVAFIIGVILSLFVYLGFDAIADLRLFGPLDLLVLKLGINEHYLSMSRGVIDTRDLIYFFSLIVLFLYFTKLKLNMRKW